MSKAVMFIGGDATITHVLNHNQHVEVFDQSDSSTLLQIDPFNDDPIKTVNGRMIEIEEVTSFHKVGFYGDDVKLRFMLSDIQHNNPYSKLKVTDRYEERCTLVEVITSYAIDFKSPVGKLIQQREHMMVTKYTNKLNESEKLREQLESELNEVKAELNEVKAELGQVKPSVWSTIKSWFKEIFNG